MKTQSVKELNEEIARFKEIMGDMHSLCLDLDVENEKTIKQLKEKLVGLNRLVFNDNLTSLLNRRGFHDKFTKLFNEALSNKDGTRPERKFRVDDLSIIFIDLDDFKKINDKYGHEQGDDVLKATAKIFKDHIREIDGAARFGGEEFVIILLGTDENDAAAKAESIKEYLNDHVKEYSKGWKDEIKVTASIGIASLSASDADDFDELVGYADQAMYEAKNNIAKYSELV